MVSSMREHSMVLHIRYFFTVQHYLEDILGIAQVDLVMPDALHKELKEGILREAIHAT
jgi:predicted nucleotidyltransferase